LVAEEIVQSVATLLSVPTVLRTPAEELGIVPLQSVAVTPEAPVNV